MEYNEFKPHPYLTPFIECYWAANADKPPFRERESLVPDGTMELMFNFGDNYAQICNDEKIPVKGSHLIGIRKHALIISQTSHQHIFSVRFRLGGAYAFFNIPSSLTANHFYTIRELLGRDYVELEEQLYEATDYLQRVMIMDQFFLSRINNISAEQVFIAKCTKTLLQQPSLKVHELANQFNTNYKNLERKFSQVIGLTPIELLKIKRFNKAILAMYSCRFSSLTEVAYECGFYDQSHFIREFKQLSGLSPRAFLQEQFTIVKVIQPALADRMSKSYNL
jgi:AraC-like DNA-binding protein